MIQKKINKNNNVLLNLLFKSKSMYGESLISTNKEILPFIYGKRHDHNIINLKIFHFFKSIFKLIKYITQRPLPSIGCPRASITLPKTYFLNNI